MGHIHRNGSVGFYFPLSACLSITVMFSWPFLYHLEVRSKKKLSLCFAAISPLRDLHLAPMGGKIHPGTTFLICNWFDLMPPHQLISVIYNWSGRITPHQLTDFRHGVSPVPAIGLPSACSMTFHRPLRTIVVDPPISGSTTVNGEHQASQQPTFTGYTKYEGSPSQGFRFVLSFVLCVPVVLHNSCCIG